MRVEAYVEEVDVHYAILDTTVRRWVAFERLTGSAITMGAETREEAEQRVRDIGIVLVEKPAT